VLRCEFNEFLLARILTILCFFYSALLRKWTVFTLVRYSLYLRQASLSRSTARTSLKAYQLSSAKLTVGRLLWSDPVKKLLAQMDYHQLFYVADKAPRIAVNNVSRFMKENVDDVLAEESKNPPSHCVCSVLTATP
jgi:hypothetical protein